MFSIYSFIRAGPPRVFPGNKVTEMGTCGSQLDIVPFEYSAECSLLWGLKCFENPSISLLDIAVLNTNKTTGLTTSR